MKCAGSWEQTARNIVYNGDIIECELETMNRKRKWVKNRFKFFPQYEYSNTNGKIEWSNCKNNVTKNSNSYEDISRRYKRISIEECLKNINENYDDWFQIENEYINCVRDKCISISLFNKNVDNTYENEHNVDNDKWHNKYFNSLINNFERYELNNMCVNLYLANDLSNYIPQLSKYDFLNIFLMKTSSVGAQPGTLWRFMDITNKSYNRVYIADIDENWEWIKSWDMRNYDYKVCTLLASDGYICNKPYTPAYNFATIIGSHIMCNPNKFNYNIVDVMKGFISLCKKRENSVNPCCFDDNDQITVWNQPVGDHIYGWGRIITKYGFDEFFLKHVIYYDAYPDILRI